MFPRSPEFLDKQLSDTDATPRPPLQNLLSSLITDPNLQLETEQEVAAHKDAIKATEGTTEFIDMSDPNDINMVERDTSSGSAEHVEDTMEVEVNAHGTQLEQECYDTRRA